MLEHGSPFSTKYRLEFGSNSSMGILKFGKMLDLSDSQPLTWSLASTFMLKGNRNWPCFISTLPNGCIGLVIEIASLLRLERLSSDTVVLPRCSYKYILYISPLDNSTPSLDLLPTYLQRTWSISNFKLDQVWFSLLQGSSASSGSSPFPIGNGN
ncbi:hypothetical protein BJX62DRAFT_103312 [Aspergillus germanicus]